MLDGELKEDKIHRLLGVEIKVIEKAFSLSNDVSVAILALIGGSLVEDVAEDVVADHFQGAGDFFLGLELVEDDFLHVFTELAPHVHRNEVAEPVLIVFIVSQLVQKHSADLVDP